MNGVLLEYLIFALYVLIGPTLWALLVVGLFAGRRRMTLLEDDAGPLPDPPRATICIPAKDEGERIGECIESALHQDYPNFHVIAIDDRSTDRTGSVMDALAERHRSLAVFHIAPDSLPAGWTGKCNALHTAVSEADGQWLLFVDSDVILQPSALSATMRSAVQKDCDVVSLLLRLESHSFWEEILVPLAGAAVSALYLIALTNNDHLPRNAFANGQYLLVRRSAYDAFGGHARVRDRFCEDIEIARLVKSTGGKVRISWGIHLAAVRMYNSIGSIFRGWARIFFAGSVGRPWRIVLGIVFLLACSFSSYVALGWGVYRLYHPVNTYGAAGWLIASIVHIGIITAALAILYAWSGNRRRNALFFPLAGPMLLGIFARSLWMCATGKVEWRGTRYSAAASPADSAGGTRESMEARS